MKIVNKKKVATAGDRCPGHLCPGMLSRPTHYTIARDGLICWTCGEFFSHPVEFCGRRPRGLTDLQLRKLLNGIKLYRPKKDA